MKKLLYMASFLALIFTACDPMEDVYDEIDEANADELADAKFFSDKTLIADGYRLTDADFELSSDENVAKYKNFSKYQAAADFLPEILTNKMLYGEAGNEYKVWFDFYRGKSEAFSNYSNKHEVSEDEYSAVGGIVADLGYFTSDVKSGDKVDEILKAAHTGAEEGDVQKFISKGAASKSYKFEDVSIEAFEKFVMGNADFEIILEMIKADDDKKHLVDAKYGTSEYYYGVSTYNNNFDGRLYKWSAYDDYKDMSDDDLEDLIYDRQTEAVIVALKAKFPDAQILDGAGKKITYIVEYSVYDGADKDKVVMFECTSDGPNPEFAKIGSLYVNTMHELYMFDGTDWKVEDDIYRLESEDYDAMGEDSGFPGKYDNFDSSMEPANYLPAFMNTKWIYAQGGDTKIIAYKYYNSGVKELRVDEYTFAQELKWTLTATVVDGSAIVAFKDKAWAYVPPIKLIKSEKDATVTHTLTDENYDLVGDGQYDNFYIKGMTPEEVDAEMIPKITKILKANFELAVGDVYEVTYSYYDGTNGTATIKLEAVADN